MTHKLDDKTAAFVRENMPRMREAVMDLRTEIGRDDCEVFPADACTWPLCGCDCRAAAILAQTTPQESDNAE
jgi:hypothetical protein